MKKIYLMGLSAMFALAVTAQTTIRIKTPLVRNKTNQETNTNAKVAGVNGINQVNGNLICNTFYTSSSTMNLVFKFTQTGNNDEWIDMFSLTFPTGMTPISSPNATFPTADNSGGAEPLNPVAGQVISWGADINDGWGGIVTTTVGVTFTVNVTIGAISGNQIVNFLASGDTYTTAGNPTPGDLAGTAFIYQTGGTVVDITTNVVGVLTSPTTQAGLTNCSLTSHTIAAQIKNLGTNSETNIPVNYMVNGNPSIVGTFPGPLAAGDSALVIFPVTFDFSAQNIYSVKAWSAMAGDMDLTNDTAAFDMANSVPVALTTTNYTNGFENAYDQSSVYYDWVGLGLPFSYLTSNSHSGTRALYLTVNMTTIGAPAGTYESFINLPCMDVTSSEIYKITFWKKAITSGTMVVNGQTGVFTGLAQDAASMTTVVKPYSALTPVPNSTVATTWTKDSVNYIATANETRYFAIGGKGTLATTADQINVRIDDITITKLGTVGIKTNSSIDAISIFPNPTSGILNVTSVEVTSSIEVFNVIGEKVYSSNLVKGNNVVDLSSLSNGAYFVKMNSNNQIITKKVVLSK